MKRNQTKEKTPILLLAYNRPDSLRLTVQSLADCLDSYKFELFVHIDPPNIYREEDTKANQEINSLLEEYKERFKSFSVFTENRHMGLANSIRKSVDRIINRYGSIIVIEDDLILSKDCLIFLSDALNYYKDDPDIWSISGWSPSLDILDKYDHDVFYACRGSSYAWATWRDRWETVDWEVCDYYEFYNDRKSQIAFSRGGYDLPELLRLQMIGMIDSWAVRWVYSQYKRKMMTVYSSVGRAVQINTESGTHVKGEFRQRPLIVECRDYLLEKNDDRNIMEPFRSFWKHSYKEWNNRFRERNLNRDKYESMFYVMDIWKKLALSGHRIEEYFIAHNYVEIAIYGKGRIGDNIKRELDGSSVKVSYFIDRNPSLVNRKDCYSPDDDLPYVDCVVVSVLPDADSVRRNITPKVKCEIKSIIEVLKDQ